MQPAQEPSTPSIPFAAANSMKAAPIERKSSRAENIFDLAVSLYLLQVAVPEESTVSGLLLLTGHDVQHKHVACCSHPA